MVAITGRSDNPSFTSALEAMVDHCKMVAPQVPVDVLRADLMKTGVSAELRLSFS